MSALAGVLVFFFFLSDKFTYQRRDAVRFQRTNTELHRRVFSDSFLSSDIFSWMNSFPTRSGSQTHLPDLEEVPVAQEHCPNSVESVVAIYK